MKKGIKEIGNNKKLQNKEIKKRKWEKLKKIRKNKIMEKNYKNK